MRYKNDIKRLEIDNFTEFAKLMKPYFRVKDVFLVMDKDGPSTILHYFYNPRDKSKDYIPVGISHFGNDWEITFPEIVRKQLNIKKGYRIRLNINLLRSDELKKAMKFKRNGLEKLDKNPRISYSKYQKIIKKGYVHDIEK